MTAPICKNCIHFEARFVNWAGGTAHACRRPVAIKFEPVRGDFIFRVNRPCSSERQKSFLRKSVCGPTGVFFEPTPKAGEPR